MIFKKVFFKRCLLPVFSCFLASSAWSQSEVSTNQASLGSSAYDMYSLTQAFFGLDTPGLYVGPGVKHQESQQVFSGNKGQFDLLAVEMGVDPQSEPSIDLSKMELQFGTGVSTIHLRDEKGQGTLFRCLVGRELLRPFEKRLYPHSRVTVTGELTSLESRISRDPEDVWMELDFTVVSTSKTEYLISCRASISNGNRKLSLDDIMVKDLPSILRNGLSVPLQNVKNFEGNYEPETIPGAMTTTST